MSTTPPKKGKKRAPPSTPSGKPPAKTSRASSPTPEPSGEFRGWEPPPRPSDQPVKSLEERQASARRRKATPAPADPSTASQMDVSEEPVLEYADAPAPPSHANTLSFATVEEPMDDADAESSFQEMIDWLRYLAQHQEQRGRLITLLTEATSTLRDLSGTPARVEPASSAAAAATSAPAKPATKNPAAAPTVKQKKRQIQNTLNRYERVSKELPGAPKTTLLNIIARSDLRTAVPPLPEPPKPRKRPSCLVKGIRANTVATHLPAEATYPPSLPAVTATVNAFLRKEKADVQIKDILQGVRRHLTVVFNKSTDDETGQLALREVLKAFNTKLSNAHILERQTYSLLKFNAVPTITSDGRPITAELAAQCLSKHPEWKKATPLAPPRFVYNKANPNAQYATLQVKVKDTLKASVAMSLLKTSVSFIGVVRRCLPWTVSPTARQCSTCLKWGHTAYTCKARFPTCDQCAGPHLSSLHNQHTSSCKDKTCSHARIICANCDDSHRASSMVCPFFKARPPPSQLQERQKARVQRPRRQSL